MLHLQVFRSSESHTPGLLLPYRPVPLLLSSAPLPQLFPCTSMNGSSSTYTLFLHALSFEGTTNLARNYLDQIFTGFISDSPSTQFTL